MKVGLSDDVGSFVCMDKITSLDEQC